MEKTITPEIASELFGFDIYDYSQLDAGILAATKDQTDPFDIIIPDHLPVGRDGSAFIPGINCYEDHPQIDRCFIVDAGLSLQETQLDVMTGIYSPRDHGIRPRLRITHPDAATHTVVVIDYSSRPVALDPPITPDSDLGRKLHVVATWRQRIGNGEHAYAQDTIVFEKKATEYCENTYSQMATWIKEEIAAGDVYEATYREVGAIYRRHMETVLLPKLIGNVMQPELTDTECRLWYCCLGEPKRLIDIYDYTLVGTQKLARFLTQIRSK